MESKPESAPKPEAPKPAHGPVMDVVAPPPAATAGEDKPHQPPQEDKPHATTDEQPATQSDPDKPVAPPEPQKPVTPKPPHTGVGLAITATVIIVLGLAALAVYAYLKTK